MKTGNMHGAFCSCTAIKHPPRGAWLEPWPSIRRKALSRLLTSPAFRLDLTGLSRTKPRCRRFSPRSQGSGCNCGEICLQMCLFDLQNVGSRARVLHLPAKQAGVSQSATANYRRPAGFKQDEAISSPARSPRLLPKLLGRYPFCCFSFWGSAIVLRLWWQASGLSLRLHVSHVSFSFFL